MAIRRRDCAPACRHLPQPSGPGEAGFTLIELMLVVAIGAILLGAGLPAFQDALQNQRVKTAASDMFLSLILARSEAIKRSANIDLVRGGTAWTDGWDVKIQSDATVLRSNDAVNGITLECNTDTDTSAETCPATVTFNRSGRATSFIEFRLYLADNDAVKMRCVNMSLSGRPSLMLDKDADYANGCL